ncbi:unnamed protein product [Phaedon cochleariae]|uniref:TGF-beta propeptide domain-containing protein n=1 Tax=Phaedon cochleariae TaxID=80249 RepID=A0A9N9SD49_PHACE|nr:unnamed protein product [Phaedon cochleariae]
MCGHLIFLACLALSLALSLAAPLESNADAYLDKFLDLYLDEPQQKVPEDDIYETMQGDQPAMDNAIAQAGSAVGGEDGNVTQYEYLMALRNRSRENSIRELKNKILQYLGRNASAIKPAGDIAGPSQLNISELFPSLFNQNSSDDDEITEKMRSFYPSCEIPANTDQELWKDDEIMNLFFNFDSMLDSRSTNIASATLRLYKLPKNGTKFSSTTGDCETSNATEEDKLLRVSIYRYTKPLKRRRGKRVLSDSKVIPENARWVELNVKPAAKAWTKSRNLGLGVQVEDQEGNMLRADKYFKGASCTVGASTPKPIPTIVVDATREYNELDRLRGRNSTSAIYSDALLLPTIDLCVVELPENYSQPDGGLNFRMNACHLKKAYEANAQKENTRREQLERVASLSDLVLPSARHIRHQRQHLAGKPKGGLDFDPRSRIVGSTVVLKYDDLQNLTDSRFNFSTINR